MTDLSEAAHDLQRLVIELINIQREAMEYNGKLALRADKLSRAALKLLMNVTYLNDQVTYHRATHKPDEAHWSPGDHNVGLE